MVKVRWTSEALRWLQEIFDYILQDNYTSAKRVINTLYDKVQVLKQFPKAGYKYKTETDGEIRILVSGHYRIAYIIKIKSIDILGVFHEALTIENYIKLSKN